MEFQLGQKVRLKPEFEKENQKGLWFTVSDVFRDTVFAVSNETQYIFKKHQLYVISVHIELERLEAAFYEYFDNIYSDPIEKYKLVRENVEELMNVVKSVSINE